MSIRQVWTRVLSVTTALAIASVVWSMQRLYADGVNVDATQSSDSSGGLWLWFLGSVLIGILSGIALIVVWSRWPKGPEVPSWSAPFAESRASNGLPEPEPT